MWHFIMILPVMLKIKDGSIHFNHDAFKIAAGDYT